MEELASHFGVGIETIKRCVADTSKTLNVREDEVVKTLISKIEKTGELGIDVGRRD